MSAALYRKLLRDARKIDVPPVDRAIQRNIRTVFELQRNHQPTAAQTQQLKATHSVLRWLQQLNQVRCMIERLLRRAYARLAEINTPRTSVPACLPTSSHERPAQQGNSQSSPQTTQAISRQALQRSSRPTIQHAPRGCQGRCESTAAHACAYTLPCRSCWISCQRSLQHHPHPPSPVRACDNISHPQHLVRTAGRRVRPSPADAPEQHAAGEPYVRVQIDAAGACMLVVITSPPTSPRHPEPGTPAPLTSGLSIPTAEEVQAADAEDLKSSEGMAEFQVLPTPPGLNHSAANGMQSSATANIC